MRRVGSTVSRFSVQSTSIPQFCWAAIFVCYIAPLQKLCRIGRIQQIGSSFKEDTNVIRLKYLVMGETATEPVSRKYLPRAIHCLAQCFFFSGHVSFVSILAISMNLQIKFESGCILIGFQLLIMAIWALLLFAATTKKTFKSLKCP